MGGISLTFFSSAGQTFYIALYAGEIRESFGLSHGGFGAVYATLASAATLIVIGKVVDHRSVIQVSSGIIVLLAVACAVMASATSLPGLLLAIFSLRLFGQGMMSHIAITAMGRWFVAERGRAVSVTALGYQLGEGVLPLAIVGLLVFVEWRTAWWLSALILLLIALPISRICFDKSRQPRSTSQADSSTGRQWTRREVLADRSFWVVCIGVLAPSFIGTSVFFHQVHLGELKQWAPSVVASSYLVLSVSTVITSLMTGQMIDRYSARQLLPLFLVPLSIGCFVLASAQHPGTAIVFMCLLGIAYGLSSAIFGAIWPEIYGTKHLGAIRSIVFAAMVFASALGPGITGWLIDVGIGFEHQLLFMGGYCLLAVLAMIPVARQLHRRMRVA